MNSNDAIAFGIGMLFLLTVIPIVGGFIYAHRERVLTHTERMKALEIGRSCPIARRQLESKQPWASPRARTTEAKSRSPAGASRPPSGWHSGDSRQPPGWAEPTSTRASPTPSRHQPAPSA